MGSAKPLNPGVATTLGLKLGEAIEERRKEKKMEADVLAGLAGVDPKAVDHWEKGRRIISNESLPRVAHALQTSPSKLYARAERLWLLSLRKPGLG